MGCVVFDELVEIRCLVLTCFGKYYIIIQYALIWVVGLIFSLYFTCLNREKMIAVLVFLNIFLFILEVISGSDNIRCY